MICDEIFGSENFIANVIWERAYYPVNLKKHFSENHDFIISYAKDITKVKCNGLSQSEDILKDIRIQIVIYEEIGSLVICLLVQQ